LQRAATAPIVVVEQPRFGEPDTGHRDPYGIIGVARADALRRCQMLDLEPEDAILGLVHAHLDLADRSVGGRLSLHAIARCTTRGREYGRHEQPRDPSHCRGLDGADLEMMRVAV